MTRVVYVVLISMLISSCSMSPPKYAAPTNKPLVRVDFEFKKTQGPGTFFVHTYRNSDGCRDYGFLFKLTGEHPADSAKLAANEDVALSFGYINKDGIHVHGHAHPIIKFRTVENHHYKVNLDEAIKLNKGSAKGYDDVIEWQVLESNGKGYSPIPTTEYVKTMPFSNSGPFCDGNIIKK